MCVCVCVCVCVHACDMSVLCLHVCLNGESNKGLESPRTTETLAHECVRVSMQAYADMLVASANSLDLGYIYMCRRQLHTLLSLLARTAPLSSPIRSFRMQQPVECPGTADLLHDALCHHTSLSSLYLDKLLCSHQGGTSPALAVLRALPHLPRLTSLHLSLHAADLSATEATARPQPALKP